MVTKGHSHPIFDVAYRVCSEYSSSSNNACTGLSAAIDVVHAAVLQFLMRRNSVYVAFILGGALVGERVSRCGALLLCLRCRRRGIRFFARDVNVYSQSISCSHSFGWPCTGIGQHHQHDLGPEQ